MDKAAQKRISKFLSLVLRHKPEEVGIQLEFAGWTDVEPLVAELERRGICTLEELKAVVALNDKQRFEFNDDFSMIRATQGHSVDIEFEYTPVEPPATLLHGTVPKFLESIRASGLTKQSRHHVHLHQELDVASAVGNRRGKAVILTIDSASMHREGHEFFVTSNKVWLTEVVPPQFIEFPEE